MNKISGNRIVLFMVIMFVVTGFLLSEYGKGSVAAQVPGTDVTYTTDADFDQGTLVSVNHDAPFNDQLQLDSPTEPFPFINVAASGRGTVVRSNTETGGIVGEYHTAPEGRGLNPSRTTVDLFGNVWTANREEAEPINDVPHGSAVKIGLIVGGTRVGGDGLPDPNGEYLAPPFGYNTCIDRDADGLIKTSKGLGDILDWPDISDGSGGADGLVEDAEDECILIYQRLADAENARHVSVDADNNVWVGGYPFSPRIFYKLDSANGAILDSFDAREFGCGGYGGLVDGSGVVWSVGGELLRYDPVTRSGSCVEQNGYGLGIDTNGNIWMSIWDGGIVKIAPDGTIFPGFPKPTFASSTTTSLASINNSRMQSTLAQREELLQPLAAAADASVTFWVAPQDDWVQSTSPWTPGATISLTVEDGTGVIYSASQTAGPGGNFNFNFWDEFDLQRGQIVTVSDGTTTKTHTVANLFVDGVDLVGDDVYGRADPGNSVDVWVHGNGGVTAAADGSGNWTADFSGETDLTYNSDGGSQQVDDDGDATGVWWASPRFEVAPEDDRVQSSGTWAAGATISLTIEDGSGVIYTDSQTADEDGRFQFNLRDLFNVQRGHVVTVSDGTTTKTHTVTNLYVDGVDVTADTVFGRADPGTAVDVWVHGDGNMTATADGFGNWVADFSGQTDLTYNSDGGSQQIDGDGDSTGVWWASPRFEVAPEDDWVQSSSSWTPGAAISLIIDDGGAGYAGSQTADAGGNFHFNLGGLFDLQRGHMVTVSDGTATKTHRVAYLYVDGVDVAADTVFGRADITVSTSVDVWVHDDGNMTATVDGSGNWVADFSGQTDLTYSSDGGSQQVDDDGDSTGVWWASPRFEVAPEDDWVQSSTPWTPDAIISLTIEDGSGVIYSDSQTADSYGNFYFGLWELFDLQRGHLLTVSDGTTTKTHTVANLFVDGVDLAADTVFGRADAGTDVHLWVHDNGNLTTTSDGSGNWTADFSSQTDLTYQSDGGSQQTDDDGDSTGVWWAVPTFQAAPEDDWVESRNGWKSDATISLTIEDGSGVVYADSQTTDNHGHFHFDLQGLFDLQRGHIVTVSDGSTTKTHTVTNLYVDGVDVAADNVFGTADPGSSVDVWVHDNGNATATADGSGNWMADFSGQTDLTFHSDGGSEQIDDDGDSTGVWWDTSRFEVSPQEQWVRSISSWTPGATITVIVEDGSGVIFNDAQPANSHGDFHIDVGVPFTTDDVVTVSDGTTTKTHTVTGVKATNIDTAADQVSGIANPAAEVDVWASLFDEGSGRRAIADLAGNWMADFSVPAYDQPAYDITEITRIDVSEYDDDGDATYRRFGPPAPQNRGVAVTPSDNHIWVANSATGTVTRLDNDGNVLKVIDTGEQPTGVAVDAAGKVWATNMGSDNIVRIDPNAGADGLGAVDLTVDLGPGASPYNYSDMTGAVVVGSTSPQGFWTVVQDSDTPGFKWGRITWNTEPEGNVPEGGAIVVEARAADSVAGLGGSPFVPVSNGELFTLYGRYIEVRVTLKAASGGQSPVLSDIRIQPHVIPVAIDIKPGSDPNSINCQNKKEVIAVAILTTSYFDALTVDHTTVSFEGAAETHVNQRSGEPVRHVEDVDGDGDMDLVFHFRKGDTALTCDSTEGLLVGETFSGIPVEGTDAVRMVKTK